VVLMCSLTSAHASGMTGPELASRLTPRPQRLSLLDGHLALRGASLTLQTPAGPDHEACRTVLENALATASAKVAFRAAGPQQGCRFTVGKASTPPPLPTAGYANDAYALAITSDGITAVSASPAGLLYAAETLCQVCRVFASAGRLPCLTIADWPEFRLRGVYIEGGQERFGRIVEKDYLCEQIRRLAEFKMNALVVECYNLFPFASFPACADEGTLSREDCREIVAEARRYHVTLIPSLMTLAQSWEIEWNNEAGKPYREPTAPGQMCPSTPEIYPFIKGLYRDLLTLFDTSPLIGIGCSEIGMQWQGRYCPRCRARMDAGETERDLLVGHALKCIEAVGELSRELGRPIRPLMWADEFYMYGPGRDWVGIERIPRDTVMGFWKYWRDYAGIEGLMERGYDVLGVSAMYNHTFYLADLSPESPKKAWPAMEQTGTLNITEMVQEAERVKAGPSAPRRPEFWGTVTASFSKHRLRAFDTIWYGFALNGHCTWSHPEQPIAGYQQDFTRAFTRHYYDCRTDAAAQALAAAWEVLDDCKSQLELANQTLHDVVGVNDTQEAGYVGNTFLGAWRQCRGLPSPAGEPQAKLAEVRRAAVDVQARAARIQASLKALEALPGKQTPVGRQDALADLSLAAEKIAAHAEREVLMIDTQGLLARGPGLPAADGRALADADARRWAAALAREKEIARRDAPLYRRGDPCGDLALLRDLGTVEAHLQGLAKGWPAGQAAETLIAESFQALDPSRWIVHGRPHVAGGSLETTAPGGWGNRCGIATRQALPLDDDHVLAVECDLTPVKMGVDSQLLASAGDAGADSYRFAFYGPRDHFGVYTRSERKVEGPWADTTPGWHLRAESAPIEPGKTYHVRLEVTPGTFRVVVHLEGDSAWDMPFWDTSQIPMDRLDETRLLFADVEPEGGTASSRWGPISILRVRRP
jgi:hypothetical protein